MKKYTFKDGRTNKCCSVVAEDINIAKVMIRMKRSLVRPFLIKVEGAE